jgi:hypothetical protein
LVDNLGGLHDALQYLKVLMHTPTQNDVDIVYYPAPETPYERLKHLLHTRSAAWAQVWTYLKPLVGSLQNSSEHTHAHAPPIRVQW